MNQEDREILIRLDENVKHIKGDVQEIKEQKLPERVAKLEGSMKILRVIVLSLISAGGISGIGVGLANLL